MINQLKTVTLLALLTALALWFGSIFGNNGLIIAVIFVLGMNLVSYFWSHKIVLMMYRAKEASESEYPDLHKTVREISHLANVPMPKLYIIPSEQANAFATGRNPKHAIVACTHGIMKLLSKDELKGVLAHEISHVKNRDILIATVAATIAGVISWLASMARWGAIFGGFGGRDDNNNIISLLVLSIVTPIIALIIQLAISRSREFLADETGAKTIHNPYALASALEKIEASVHHHPLKFGSPATSSLFIANPFKGKGLMNLLSTHPPTEERVKRLRSMSP